ncbi:helix-turn-helix domain-containing protein [Enterococcus sp. RIT-PI-f]|uniref:helix-turn-helix domain-containing protein n=1 Tax=Enterococcus sp. RIT-PI-f TaxID=1690244 RepID=UPI0006B8DE7A|nr:helix-turn-helix transcriptional regulator [Enterococcus sp. RIT-PI-f]KPG70820.1 DNA-binding protein [Enterococcus sp. RIT-PI-f]
MHENSIILIQIIENIRKKRKLSQKDLVAGILSESVYTRLKQGKKEIPMFYLVPLTKRLNARIEDILDLYYQSENYENKYLFKRYNIVTDSHDVQEAILLYNDLLENENNNLTMIRLRMLLEKYFSNDTTQIPKIDITEVQALMNQILVTTYLTSYDLQFFADFMTLLSTDQLQIISQKLLTVDFNVMNSFNHFYKKYYPICLGNLSDCLMDLGYFDESKIVLDKLAFVADHVDSIELKMWAQYLTNVLNIYMDDQPNEKQRQLNKLNKIVTDWQKLLPSSHLVEGLHGAFQRLSDRNGARPNNIQIQPVYILKP